MPEPPLYLEHRKNAETAPHTKPQLKKRLYGCHLKTKLSHLLPITSTQTPAALIYLLFSREKEKKKKKSRNSGNGEVNHSTLHVSFEIKCHGYDRNFLSVDEREVGVEKKNNKLSEVYSVQLHMSYFRVRGQIAVFFYFLCHAHAHSAYTMQRMCGEKKKKRKDFGFVCCPSFVCV